METRPNSISIRSRRATYLALLRLGDFRLLLIIDQLLGGGGVVLVSRHGNSIFRVSKSSRVKTWRECVRNRVSVGQSAFTTLGNGETHGLVVEPLGGARSISRWSQGHPRARALVVHLTLWRGHCVPSRNPFASQPHDLSVEWSGGPVHAGLARVDLGQAVGGRSGGRSAVGGRREVGREVGREGGLEGGLEGPLLLSGHLVERPARPSARPQRSEPLPRVSLRTHGPTSPQADDDDERTCVDCSQTHVAARPDDHCTTGRGSLSDLRGCIPETSEWTCFSHPAHPAHPPHVCILLRYPPRGAAEGVGARARELRPVVGRKFPASALVGTWYINVL